MSCSSSLVEFVLFYIYFGSQKSSGSTFSINVLSFQFCFSVFQVFSFQVILVVQVVSVGVSFVFSVAVPSSVLFTYYYFQYVMFSSSGLHVFKFSRFSWLILDVVLNTTVSVGNSSIS